jgi:hypothetical protein
MEVSISHPTIESFLACSHPHRDFKLPSQTTVTDYKWLPLIIKEHCGQYDNLARRYLEKYQAFIIGVGECGFVLIYRLSNGRLKMLSLCNKNCDFDELYSLMDCLGISTVIHFYYDNSKKLSVLRTELSDCDKIPIMSINDDGFVVTFLESCEEEGEEDDEDDEEENDEDEEEENDEGTRL